MFFWHISLLVLNKLQYIIIQDDFPTDQEPISLQLKNFRFSYLDVFLLIALLLTRLMMLN